MPEFKKKTALGLRDLPENGQECTHVLLTHSEYDGLLAKVACAERDARSVYQGCSEYISAVSADLVDAQILHINPGVPLLNSRRIARCNLGPLEYAVLRIRTDVMELCITMGPNLESNSLN